MLPDRRGLTLQPLVTHGVFEPGPARLSCTVGGVEYYADLGSKGEIIFEGKEFRSPSAFSVYVKRKINPGRKADDGWTSVKYLGEILSNFRAQLEQFQASDHAGAHQPPPAALAAAAVAQPNSNPTRSKRRARTKQPLNEQSDDEPAAEDHGEWPEPTTDDLECDDAMDEFVAEDSAVMLVPAVDIDHTWIQCENSACQKWRRVRYVDVPEGPWYCSSNPDARYNSCGAPQELSDEEIDRLMVEGAMARHVASSRRPPLERCSPEVFEADLITFLEARGDEQLANFLRERRITCNNIPLDVFGLYREVVRLGGFLANERYDDRGRWAGGINFAGEVFPRLKNWTPHNRATSVGNQLLNNYKKFLLQYERAHLPQDLPHVAHSLAAGVMPPVRRPPGGFGAGVSGVVVESASRGGRAQDALAFLADVAGASGGVDSRPPPWGGSGTRSGGGGSQREEVADDAPMSWGGRADRKRRRADETKAGGVWHQDLWNVDGSQVAAAGQLLLAQDPRDPGRHWAVVVADAADVPCAVAEGGACAPECQGLPQALDVRPSHACLMPHPMAVLGRQQM